MRSRIRPPAAPVVPALVASAAVVGLLSGYRPELGLAVALGLSFVALVFVDVLVGFAVMLLSAYLETYSVVGSVSITKLIGVLLVVSWLAAVTIDARRHRNFLREQFRLTYLLALFIGWAAISVVWSAERGDALTSVSRYVLNAALLPIAYAAIRNRRDAVRILGVLVAGAAIAGVTGILERPDASSLDYARAAGTIGDPNELAAALLVGLCVGAGFTVNRHIAFPMRLLAAIAVLVSLGGILTTLSRGGLIGLGASVALAVPLAGRWRPRVVAAAGTIAVAAVGYFAFFASLPAKERVLNVGGGGSGRLDLWTIAERMIAAHPVRGVGAGQFPTASVHYLLQPGVLQRADLVLLRPKVAHNTYLNVTAELGVVGLLLFLAILLVCVGCTFVSIRHFRRAGDERMEILARSLAVGLGGYLVTLLFISENYSKLMWILFALGPVLLVLSRRAEAHRHAEAPPDPLPETVLDPVAV